MKTPDVFVWLLLVDPELLQSEVAFLVFFVVRRAFTAGQHVVPLWRALLVSCACKAADVDAVASFGQGQGPRRSL